MEDKTDGRIPKSSRIAILGTGPISLLHAYLLAKSDKNLQIILFDSAAQAGGAWYTEYSPKGHEIECGCHIWSYVPEAYHFIEKELGVKLISLKPKPVFTGSSAQLSYTFKHTIDSYKAIFKNIFVLKWKTVLNFRKDPAISFRVLTKNMRYPRKGSPELVHALLNKISALKNITIKLNSNVDGISIDPDQVAVFTPSENYTFDKVFFSYVSRIKTISVNGVSQPVSSKTILYVHFLIRLNEPLQKKISYWRFINDPVVHRITDISYQTEFEENLILVGIKEAAFHSNESEYLQSHVQTLLKKHKLISDKTTLDVIRTHEFPTTYLTDETLSSLQKVNDRLTFLRTTDLMHGIYFLLEKNYFLTRTPM